MNYHGLVRPRITLYSLFHGFYSIENCFKLNRKLRVPSDEIIALCFYGQQCTVWPCMTQQHGLERPIVVFYGLVGSFIVFQGLAQSFMAFHGFVWPFYGLIWSFYGLLFENIVLNGLGWSFLAVIDPNSFGLVFSKSSCRKSLNVENFFFKCPKCGLNLSFFSWWQRFLLYVECDCHMLQMYSNGFRNCLFYWTRKQNLLFFGNAVSFFMAFR